jgi:hypothetical protein
VTDQDTADTVPEVNALHRKYRIQKDRLIAWGLEWSDNTKGKQGDIDESVERAGLTETVTSVLGTIKDILDEAERMQHAAQPAGTTGAGEKTRRPSDQGSWAASDRSRYEDLAKDLTTSIDTLYDLSRTRRSHRDIARGLSPAAKSVPEPPKGSVPSSVFLSSEYNASDATLINPGTFPHLPSANISTRTGLPPKLDPSNLVLPLEEPPPYESVGVSSSIRVIGHLKSTHSSTNPWKTEGGKAVETPVLVEYATFDATYRFTEVSPPLDRLDTLLGILVRLANEQSFHGTLHCLGYFEDPKQPRFGLVFELPSFVYSGPSDSHKTLEELRPVTLLSVLQTGSRSLHNSNSATPPLEDRFRLAFTLARTFSKVHAESFVHKDVNSSNILVFRKNRPLRSSSNSRALQYALRSPVICSFDLFSEYDIEPPHTTMSSPNIYRHPEDPKFTGEKTKEYGPQFDLYGLGLVLLEVGLWLPLSDLWKARYSLVEFKQRVEENYIRRLASKCGTAYMQVVRDCFWAAERIASGADSLQNVSTLYSRILVRLQRCCLLDEADPSFDWSELASAGAPSAGSVAGAGTAPPGPSPLKRKSASTSFIPTQATDIPPSPSAYRSAKRWALEKGTQILAEKAPQILERNKSSQSKPSTPDQSSISRSTSRASQRSIRKSISHTLQNITSPKDSATVPMDWAVVHEKRQDKDPLEESVTLVNSSRATTSTFVDENEQMGIAKALEPPKTMTLKDYKAKITMIQQLWRRRKQNRTTTTTDNAVGALVTSSHCNWPQATIGYPTPEPEIEHEQIAPDADNYITSSIQIKTDVEAPPRPKLRLHPVKFAPNIVDDWHNNVLPKLERLVERALKDSEETVSIDLVAIGDTQATARPTIFVTCSSTSRVKAVLVRKFRYDDTVFDLKVRRGKVRRSKLSRSSRRKNAPHRSMMNTDAYNADMQVMNPFHQQRPLCGASIGAFRKEHLPPVSYGGVILVDDKPFGMSVHHLLDAPSEDEDSEYGDDPNDAILSSANSNINPWLAAMGSQPGVQIASNSPAPAWDLEISDDEDLKPEDDFDNDSLNLSSDSEFDSEDSEADDDAASMSSHTTTGDISGVSLGEGDNIKITQPALDDVEDDFFPNLEDRDEDHLDSHELGHVHASSGIRRWKRNNIVHEIDWALLKLSPERLQPYNLVQGGRRFCANPGVELDQQIIRSKLAEPVCRRNYRPEEDEYPNKVASADSLGGLGVHCFGRTSGLQGGIVGAAMSSVRIYRRKTFSRSWHVLGGFGVGGDSGAWVIQNTTHNVCGHVLAWCERNNIAYICPMEILLQDIKRALGAKRIFLPGSVEEAEYRERVSELENGNATVGRQRVRERENERETVRVGSEKGVPELERGVQGLGIVETTNSSTSLGTSSTGRPIPPPPPSRRSSAKPSAPPASPASMSSSRILPPLELSLINGVPVSPLNTIADPKHPDKENVPVPVPISRVMRVKDGMLDAGNGWVEMGVGVGAGRGGRVV